MTGPLTGQISPLAEGVVSPPTASEVALGTACAALIRAASCALTGLEGGRLARVVPLLLTHRDEALVLRGARARKPLLGRDELVAHLAHLVRPRLDHARCGLHLRLGVGCALPEDLHAVAAALDLVGDPAVLRAELADIVELVDQVGEAGGGKQHVERVGLIRLVDLDQPQVEPLLSSGVLAPEEGEALAQQVVELGDPGEPLTVERQVLLERGQAHGHVAHLRLERADLRRDRTDLDGELGLAGSSRLDLLVQVGELAVDRLLALLEVLRGRRRAEAKGDNEKEDEATGHPESFVNRSVVPLHDSPRSSATGNAGV